MVYNDLRVWPSWYDGEVLGVVCDADYACYVGSVLYNVVIIALACGRECVCVCVCVCVFMFMLLTVALGLVYH